MNLILLVYILKKVGFRSPKFSLEHHFDGIRRVNPQATVSVEDVQSAEQALLRNSPPVFNLNFLNRIKVKRRGNKIFLKLNLIF